MMLRSGLLARLYSCEGRASCCAPTTPEESEQRF
jgi:hypothetical protein